MVILHVHIIAQEFVISSFLTEIDDPSEIKTKTRKLEVISLETSD